MEKSNRQNFFNIVEGQSIQIPEHLQAALNDPEVLAIFEQAFAEKTIYMRPFLTFAKILKEKHGINNNSGEFEFIKSTLLQNQQLNELERMADGEA